LASPWVPKLRRYKRRRNQRNARPGSAKAQSSNPPGQPNLPECPGTAKTNCLQPAPPPWRAADVTTPQLTRLPKLALHRRSLRSSPRVRRPWRSSRRSGGIGLRSTTASASPGTGCRRQPGPEPLACRSTSPCGESGGLGRLRPSPIPAIALQERVVEARFHPPTCPAATIRCSSPLGLSLAEARGAQPAWCSASIAID